MSTLVLNDGAIDINFEPAYREGGASVFEADASTTDRPRVTAVLSKIANSSSKRKERVVSRLPVTINQATGEVAYVVINTEVSSDQRISSAEVLRALTIHRNALQVTSVAEMITEHRMFYG
jgi:hypothetical protein